MKGSVRVLVVGQAVISLFFLVLSIFSPVKELDKTFVIISVLAGISSAAFIIYSSQNPVAGSEDTTLHYFYVLLSSNCLTVVITVLRWRLHKMTQSTPSVDSEKCTSKESKYENKKNEKLSTLRKRNTRKEGD